MPTVTPIGNRVLVRPHNVSETSAGGILIPEAARLACPTASVIALGVGKEDGQPIEFPFSVTDTVLIDSPVGIPAGFEDGDPLIIIDATRVFGVVRPATTP